MRFHLHFAFFQAGNFGFGQFFQFRIVPVQGFLIKFEGVEQVFVLVKGDDDLFDAAVFLAHGAEPAVVAYDFGVTESNSQVLESGVYRF